MYPLVLEMTCREMRLGDTAIVNLKKNLRLARSDVVRKRKEINRSLCQFRAQLTEKDKVINAICGVLKAARIGSGIP